MMISNIKRKNISYVKTNSDLGYVGIYQLLKNEGIIGDNVRGANDIFFANCYRNSNSYTNKDVQIQICTNGFFIGGNSDFNLYMLVNDIFALVAKTCPFATCQEVKNYISGECEGKVIHARDVRCA